MRTLSRLALVGLIGGGAAACSSDTMRFGDPFTNPFASSGAEPGATGSLPEEQPAAPMHTAPIRSQALGAPVPATHAAPMPLSSRPVPAAPAQSPRAVAAAPVGGGKAGWSAEGGSSITVGPGDTLNQISTRYGVPPAAILSANGLSGAAQVTPGRRLVLPVYNAGGSAALTPRETPPAQPRMVLQQGRPAAEPARKVAEAREEPAPEPKAHPRPGRAAAIPAKPAAAERAAKLTARTPAPVKAAKVEAKEEARREVKEAKSEAKHETKREAKDAKRDAKHEAKEASKETGKREAKTAPAKAEPKMTAKAEPKKPVEAPKVVAKAELPKPEPKVEAAKPVKPAEKPVAEKAPEPAPAPAAAADDSAFRWPARGRVIAGYGSSGNEGINIALPEGTPVKAAEEGTVAYAGSDVKGYGKLVLVRHSNGYVSAYAHNGEIDVRPGDKVKRGQVIAKSGASGNVTSPQLHFEIRKGATPVDPIPKLASN